MAEEASRLGQHRSQQQIVVFGVQFFVGRCEFDVAQVEPLTREFVDKAFDFRVVDHPLDLSEPDLWVTEFAF